MKRNLSFPLILLLLLLILSFWMTNAYLAPPDFAAYYSYPRSILFDRDLDFSSEYEHFGYQKHMFYVTSANRLSNDWPMGTGLVWTVFLAAGSVPALVSGQPLDGYGAPFLSLVTIGILFLVGCGLFGAFRFLARRFGEKTAFASVLMGFFGTPLLFYSFYGGLMSHATGFFVITFFFILWADTIRERKRIHWILLGFLAGLMALVRPQHILCLVVFPVEYLFKKRGESREGETFQGGEFLRGSLFAFFFFILALLPRFFYRGVVYGNPFFLPKLEEMHWFRPALFETLFSDYHGLLPWTPLVLPGSLGLFFLWKKNRIMAAGFLACLVLQLYVNSANQVWWAGGSFSNRRFTGYGFIFMGGLAALLEDKKRRLWLVPCVLFCMWSFLLVIAERMQLITLEHYIPWNGAFFRSLGSVLGSPHKWPAALWGDFAGLSLFPRFVAVFFLGGLFLGMGYLFSWKRIMERKPVGVIGAILIYYIFVTVMVAVSSIRTPALPEKTAGRCYKTNRFLWNNYYEEGFYLLLKGRLQKSLSAFHKARNLIPERPQPYRYIGAIHEELGEYDEAERYYLEALSIDPNYLTAKKSLEAMRRKRKGYW